ncbi:MAG: glycosyltransferase family 39 protein, partial [Rhodocyclaceae bacterium]|nr:glycosyltransferase family 39 protein [Rhodocyclaceae bacterium]
LRNVRDDSRTSVRRFLWIWSGFVVLFFSLSGTKLPHYVLYGITPLFILIAAHRDTLRRAWLHLAAPSLLLAVFPALPWIFSALSNSTAGDAYYRAQLGRALELADARYYIGTLAALLIWIVVMLRWRQALWKRLVVAAALQVTVLAALVVPYAGALVQGPVRDMAIKLREMDEAVTLKSFTAPSFSVYRQAVTQREEPAPGGLAVTRIDRIPQTGYDTLAIEGGVALVRRHTE